MIPGLLFRVSVGTAAGLRLADFSPQWQSSKAPQTEFKCLVTNIHHEPGGFIPTKHGSFAFLPFSQVQVRSICFQYQDCTEGAPASSLLERAPYVQRPSPCRSGLGQGNLHNTIFK